MYSFYYILLVYSELQLIDKIITGIFYLYGN